MEQETELRAQARLCHELEEAKRKLMEQNQELVQNYQEKDAQVFDLRRKW